MNKLIITFLIFFIGLSVFSPIAFADTDFGDKDGNSITLINPIKSDSIMGIIDTIIIALRNKIAPPLLAIMILVGAFQMLFAGGNPESFSKGKRTIVYAIIGYAIILIASGISSIIRSLLSS